MNLADRASSFLLKGIREIVGPSSHHQIRAWIKRCEQEYPTDIPIDDSKYAWCGVFVGNVILEANTEGEKRPKPPRYFQSAKNWQSWGKAVVEPKAAQRGDVVVLTRAGGHHVAIVAGLTVGGLKVIGGNQGDAVSVAEYPWSRVVVVRRG